LKVDKKNINDLLNEFNRELQSINNQVQEEVPEEGDRKTVEMVISS